MEGAAAVTISKAKLGRFKDYGFSICFPFNHDRDLWGKLSPYAEIVEEIYAGLHPRIFPSARVWNCLDNPDEHLAALIGLLEGAATKDVALNIIMNTTPVREIDEGEIVRSLERLMDVGEVRVTVCDLRIAMKLRETFPDLMMEVSTIANVDSQYGASLWRDLIAPDTIVISREINKNLPRIKRIRELGFRIKMVVSDLCTPQCPSYLRHFTLHSSQLDGKSDYDRDAVQMQLCAEIKGRTPVWHWVKKEVLPFHLPRYKGFVDVFKLCDRLKSTEQNLETLRSYVLMEDDVHPFFNYREPEESIDRLSTCDWACTSCGWCEREIAVLGERSVLPNRTAATGNAPGSLSVFTGEEDEREIKEAHEELSAAALEPEPESVGLESIRQLKAELEEERNTPLLKLLGLVLKNMRPYISNAEALSNGLRFHRISRSIEEALAIEWRRDGLSLLIALVAPDYGGEAAFRGPNGGLMLVKGSGSDDVRKLFREVEGQLRRLIV